MLRSKVRHDALIALLQNRLNDVGRLAIGSQGTAVRIGDIKATANELAKEVLTTS